MFCLSSVLRKTILNKQIVNSIRQTPALFHTSLLLLRREIEELESAQSVEKSLFENSERHSKFVNKRDLLYQFDENRRHRKKKEQTNQIATVSLAQKKPVNKTPSELIIDEDVGFRYTKLQRSDKTFNELMLLVKSRKHRNVKHQLLLEGRRLILDAVNCGLSLKYLIFSDINQLKLVAKVAPKDVTCYKVSEGDLSFWSTLTTCPGLMAIVDKPVDMSDIWKQQDSLPIIVICDQIREPNNIGAIIRACAALPVEKIILTKGCADQWDTKALRGGAGSQFLIPTMGPMHWDSIYSFLPSSYNILVAENKADNAEKSMGAYQMDRFVAYTDIPQSDGCVIVIGGETEGVSREAYELMNKDHDGRCVHIPLANGVESLNTSTALAVLLFEIRKRMQDKMVRVDTITK